MGDLDCRYTFHNWLNRSCWQIHPVADLWPTAEERWCGACRRYMAFKTTRAKVSLLLEAVADLVGGRQLTKAEGLAALDRLACDYHGDVSPADYDWARRRINLG